MLVVKVTLYFVVAVTKKGYREDLGCYECLIVDLDDVYTVEFTLKIH